MIRKRNHGEKRVMVWLPEPTVVVKNQSVFSSNKANSLIIIVAGRFVAANVKPVYMRAASVTQLVEPELNSTEPKKPANMKMRMGSPTVQKSAPPKVTTLAERVDFITLEQ